MRVDRERLLRPYSVVWNATAGGAYGIVAKATDTLGAWATSSRVIARVNFATAQEGPPMSGMGLWYKADAGITSAAAQKGLLLADQSGFERNAVQPASIPQPTLITGGNGNRP